LIKKNIIISLTISFLLFIPFITKADVLPIQYFTTTFDIKYENKIIQDEICIDLYTSLADEPGYGPKLHYAYLTYENNGSRTYYKNVKDLKSLCLEAKDQDIKMGLSGRNAYVKKCLNGKDCGWREEVNKWRGSSSNLAIYIPKLDQTFHIKKIDDYYQSPDNNHLIINIKSDGTINVIDKNGNIINRSKNNNNTNTHNSNSVTKNFVNNIFNIKFLTALLLTILLESIVVIAFIHNKYKLKRIILSLLGANIISFTILWGIFSSYPSNDLYELILEFSIIIFEAIFIYLFNKKEYRFYKFLFISFLMNIVSLFLGGYILSLIIK